jgi:hypothetical protein
VSDSGPSLLQRGVGQMTACKSCGERIAFARSASTGKLMPFGLDAAAGEWVLENGTAIHVGKAPATPVKGVETVQRWTSHFVRCPEARRWRRR